jgi:homoserine dehydrogenase
MTLAQLSPDRASSLRDARRISEARVALLGLGNVGTAVARLALSHPQNLSPAVRITGALVRDPAARARPQGVPLTTAGATLFDEQPDLVVEVLGGLEPARTLVLAALHRGIPVVTANKSLLAHHGDELFETALRLGVPLRYEAAVIAGVPFLGTFARRPLASAITSITGVVNGTTNFILSELADGRGSFGAALERAQEFGFAEPDPSKDVDGIDATEKLCVLLRHFGRLSASPHDIETVGIRHVTSADLAHARELGGTLKPIVHAEWSGATVSAYGGPAFVPIRHPLSGLEGTRNGVSLRSSGGTDLYFSGPGAGPEVTAITVLDDVVEAIAEAGPAVGRETAAALHEPKPSAWFIRLASSTRLPSGPDIADLLGGHGVWVRRTSATDGRDGRDSRWLLTYAYARPQIESALAVLADACECSFQLHRALESSDE